MTDNVWLREALYALCERVVLRNARPPSRPFQTLLPDYGRLFYRHLGHFYHILHHIAGV